MEKSPTALEIAPLNPIGKLDQKPSPWKLYFITIFGILSVVILNTIPGLKQGLFNLGTAVESIGWPGPVMLILVNGLFIIPLGMPCLLFEMVLALLIPNFVYALSLSMSAKLIGATISFVLTKYIMKKTIRKMFDDVKAYKNIECAVEKSPFKFSLILRITIIPLFLKNYGLAVPKSVTFKLYMLCVLVTTVPVTAINIYLVRQAGNITNLLNGSQSIGNVIGSLVMVTMSACALIYTTYYSKRVLRELEEKNMSVIELQDSPKSEEGSKMPVFPTKDSPDHSEVGDLKLLKDIVIEISEKERN